MINFFLNEHEGLTSRKRKIIQKRFLSRRKYNPFHLDCQYTKKKLCYCKKNILSGMTQSQKIQLWTKSYLKPYEFYSKDIIISKKTNTSQSKQEQSKLNNKYQQMDENNRMEQKQKDVKQIKVSEKQVIEAARQFNICIQKIRALSREEVVKFVQEHSKKYRRAIIQTADSGNMLNQF